MIDLVIVMMLAAIWDIGDWPLGKPYVDGGACGVDQYDGDVTSRIVVRNRVDVSRVATYWVEYMVADSSGNTARAVRTVTVVDRVSPEITLRGPSTMTVRWFGGFADPGVIAMDNYDGDISGRVTRSGTVRTWWRGTYRLVYAVRDVSGNGASVTRTVIVK
jgi:hypothetical protein